MYNVNCQRFNEYVFDYCEDNLSPALKEQMDKHLQECSYCSHQVYLTHLENEVLRDKSNVPILADDFTDRVMKHISGVEPILAFNSKGTKKHGRTKARSITLAAAAVGLAVLLIIYVPQMLSHHQSTKIADNPPPVGSGQHTENYSADEIQTQPQAKYEKKSADNNHKSAQSLPEYAVNQNDTMPPTQVADIYLDSATADEELLNEDHNVNIQMSAAVDTQLYDTGPMEAESVLSESDFMYLKPSEDLQTPSRRGTNNARADKVNDLNNLPAPYHVPGNFTLINTVNSYSTEGSAVEYHYTDRTNQSLIITLQNLNDQEPVMMMKQDSKSSQVLSGSAGNASKEDLEMTYHVDVNGQAYQVTLEGSLSAEDLVKLAEVITFTDSSPSSPSR